MNARELGKDGARRVPKACLRLPLLKHLPQRVGEKADQDVGLDTLLFVMPDRTDAKIGFVDTEGGLRFAQLNVGLPQLLVGPVVDVAAKKIRGQA